MMLQHVLKLSLPSGCKHLWLMHATGQFMHQWCIVKDCRENV